MTRLEATGLLVLIGVLSSLLQGPARRPENPRLLAARANWTWNPQVQPASAGWFESTCPQAYDWFFPQPQNQPVAIELFL